MKQNLSNPASAKEITRAYFDSLVFEQRLMDSAVPDTGMTLYGKKFATPVMTAALSHLGTFHPDMPNGMVSYGEGAAKAGAVHWVGMGSNEEFADIMATGAQSIRIVKPYADEDKIYDMLTFAEKQGALAVGMDIDHMFDSKGNPDICLNELMAVKSSEDLRRYADMTKLPFIIKGVLSVRDAAKCAGMGAGGIVVSHHNGRIPYAMPPLSVLPEIVKEVGSVMPVFVDCGICSGADAYKALALGATAVSVGVHLIPHVKQGGEAVAARIQEMTEELRGIMAYTGVKHTGAFDPTVIHCL